MPDEIKERLESSTQQCVKTYEAWRKDEKSESAREALQDAVHEVRKVAARLEIELVTSKRDNTERKPLVAPSHRSSKGPQQPRESADGNKSAAKNDERDKALQKLKKKPDPKEGGNGA